MRRGGRRGGGGADDDAIRTKREKVTGLAQPYPISLLLTSNYLPCCLISSIITE
jgi:hypothetical protein